MQRNLGQRIAYVCALLCYGAAVASALGAYLFDSPTPQDPIRASLMASVVFFIGCGVVLHVIGKAKLHGLLSGSDDAGVPPG
jgi:uncharacterized membrane protein YhiD involved in acid resistance